MKVQTPTIALLLILLHSSSCKKVYDYIDRNPTLTCDACKITQATYEMEGHVYVFDFSYDKKNQLTKIEGQNISYTLTKYFRYDKQGRVTDYIQAFWGQLGVMVWNRYTYKSKNLVLDSAFEYEGLINDPHPPASAFYFLRENYLDNYGRIKKTIGIPLYGPKDTTIYNYDAHGNLQLDWPPFTYDNKINTYRTNEMLQFVFRDYSANNHKNVPPSSVLSEPLSYNSYGLPTKYKGGANDPILGFSFDTLIFKYDCDTPKMNY